MTNGPGYSHHSPDAREAWRKRAGGYWEWLEPDLEDWVGALKKRDRGAWTRDM